MISHLRAFARSSALYTIAVSIEAVVPFILLPILTRTLEPSEYGMWVIFIAFYACIRPLITFNLQDAIRSRFQYFADSGVHGLVVGAILIATVMTALAELVIYLFRSQFAAGLRFPEAWLWAAPLTAYVYGIFYLFLAVFQFRGDFRGFVRIQLFQAGLGLTLVIILVASGFDWRGAIVGRIAGVTITLLIAWPQIARSFRLSFDAPIPWRTLFAFSIKYLPAGIGVVVIPLTNRLFVAHYAGVVETGFLGVASLFGAALGLVTTGYLFAWQPLLFRALKGETTSAERLKVRAFLILFSVSVPLVGLVLILASKTALPFLVPPSYLPVITLIGISIWGGVAQAYFEQSQTVLLGDGKEGSMSLVYILVVSMNLLLNFSWVQRYGCEGSLTATCVAFAVGACVSSLFAFQPLRRAIAKTEL